MADPYADLGAEDEDDAYADLGIKAESALAAPVIAPNGPVLRAPERTAYNTLRNMAEASGTVPKGIIPDEGTLRGAIASTLQGAIPYGVNWADEAAGLMAERDAALENLRKPRGESVDPGWAYREGRDAFRNVEGAFQKEHPAAAFALQTGAAMLAPSPRGSTSGSFATRALSAGGQGAIAGAGAAAEAEDIPFASAVGAPLGVAGQAVGELLGDAAGEVARRVGQSRLFTGIVQPSPAAQYLRSKHVGGLTIGQMAPESPLAQLEEASTSAAGFGPAIKGQRDVALQQWQQAVVREGLPPGQTDAVGDDLGEQMASVFGGFQPAYDVAKGHAIDPRSVQAALHAVDDPAVYASESTRSQVGKFIQDQMTALRLRSDGAVDSGDVIALRSFLRQELRNLPDDARQERALFQASVDSLSNALDTELPANASAMLRAADVQYAKAKTVADAVGRAKDQPDGFTTKQLSTAVAQNTPTAVYQQGGGGELRALARAGEQALAPKIPLTGARLLSAGPVPYLTSPLAYMMNLPGPKAALLGGTALQQSVRQGAPEAAGMIGGAFSRMGPAATYAWRNAQEAPTRGDTTSSELIQGILSETPEALGPYAQQLQQAAADGNLPIVHYALQQKDMQYRRLLDQFRTGGTQ